MSTEIFKALADENRIRILNVLFKNKLCVCELETILDMSQSNVSRHLNKLKNVGIITWEKSSQWIFYKISSNFIKENKMLYDYLCANISGDEQHLRDLRVLEIYTNSIFTCEQLNRDREKVRKYIHEQKTEG